MRGKDVTLKAYGNCAKVAKIWEIRGDVVFITNAETMEQIENKRFALFIPVGFYSEDVYEFDLAWVNSVDLEAPKETDWACLSPLTVLID